MSDHAHGTPNPRPVIGAVLAMLLAYAGGLALGLPQRGTEIIVAAAGHHAPADHETLQEDHADHDDAHSDHHEPAADQSEPHSSIEHDSTDGHDHEVADADSHAPHAGEGTQSMVMQKRPRRFPCRWCCSSGVDCRSVCILAASDCDLSATPRYGALVGVKHEPPQGSCRIGPANAALLRGYAQPTD